MIDRTLIYTLPVSLLLLFWGERIAPDEEAAGLAKAMAGVAAYGTLQVK